MMCARWSARSRRCRRASRHSRARPRRSRRRSPRRSSSVRRRRAGPARPFRTYRSSGGLEIWVGRGASSNDALTFHESSPRDVWLHARDSAGAHVVLRWTSDDAPPSRDLEEAAVLAAWHSKSRGSGLVPVDWTRRKYVRKARGGPPGQVLVQRAEDDFREAGRARGAATAEIRSAATQRASIASRIARTSFTAASTLVSAARTIALPTTTPSASCATAAACSGPETPKPTHTGSVVALRRRSIVLGKSARDLALHARDAEPADEIHEAAAVLRDLRHARRGRRRRDEPNERERSDSPISRSTLRIATHGKIGDEQSAECPPRPRARARRGRRRRSD